MSVLHITDKTFEQEVLRSEKPVLLDFFATWCGPCSRLAPILDKLAEAHPELKVAKLDVDAYPELARQHKVFSIPTLVVYKNGEITARAAGLQSEDAILNLL